MSHKANYAYIRMALGLPFTYSFQDAETDVERIFNGKKPAMVDYVWTGEKLVTEICKAWGITRDRFIRSMAAPKPSLIAHLIFNDELKKFYGETLPRWPKGRGLIIPQWNGREIETIRFYPLREMLKPKQRA